MACPPLLACRLRVRIWASALGRVGFSIVELVSRRFSQVPLGLAFINPTKTELTGRRYLWLQQPAHRAHQICYTEG